MAHRVLHARCVNACHALIVVGDSGQDVVCARSPSERGVRGGHARLQMLLWLWVRGESRLACLCGESERLRINTVSVTARPLLAVELRATCGTPAESKLVPRRFRRFERRWLDLFA